MKFNDRPKQNNSSDGPTLYIRLKDGEAINIIPRGEIYEFYSVFGQRGEAKSTDAGAKLRFKVNVVVNEGGTLKAKILEFGSPVYDQLAEINKICDVTKTKIRFSRKGTGKSDTTYMLLPVINEPIGQNTLKTIDAIPLNILGVLSSNKNQSQQEHRFAPESRSDEGPQEIPF